MHSCRACRPAKIDGDQLKAFPRFPMSTRTKMTLVMVPGRSQFMSRHSTTPSARAARKTWSDSWGMATPRACDIHSLAVRLFRAARFRLYSTGSRPDVPGEPLDRRLGAGVPSSPASGTTRACTVRKSNVSQCILGTSTACQPPTRDPENLRRRTAKGEPLRVMPAVARLQAVVYGAAPQATSTCPSAVPNSTSIRSKMMLPAEHCTAFQPCPWCNAGLAWLGAAGARSKIRVVPRLAPSPGQPLAPGAGARAPCKQYAPPVHLTVRTHCRRRTPANLATAHTNDMPIV